MNVAALIPAFNEADSIAQVVNGVKDLVSRVIVVDDGSIDGTAERASLAGADVLRHPSNRGKGEAVRTGLGRVLAGDFTHVLLLDGDMQHLPAEAPRLLDAAERTGADLVLGMRCFNRDSMPFSRYYSNRLGSRVLSWFVGTSIEDTQCGFRLSKTDALKGITLTARGYEIETEILVKIRRRGGHIVGVPVSAVYAGQSSKLRPVRDTTRTCFLAVYYQFLERV